MLLTSKILQAVLLLIFVSACSTAQIKARKEVREKAANSSHLYCEFVNGENFPDIDVALNIQVAKFCEAKANNISLTSYRSPSDAIGIVYCCGLKDGAIDKANKEALKESKELQFDSKDSPKAAGKDLKLDSKQEEKH